MGATGWLWIAGVLGIGAVLIEIGIRIFNRKVNDEQDTETQT